MTAGQILKEHGIKKTVCRKCIPDIVCNHVISLMSYECFTCI